MTKESKYLKLAQQLITDIKNGLIKEGEKLPSLRNMMSLHGISLTTALAAYRYLEQQGFAIAENKKGYFATSPLVDKKDIQFPNFACQVTQLKEPQFTNNVLSQDTLATAKIDEQLIDLNLIKKSFSSALKNSSLKLSYQDAQGNRELRKYLAAHFKQQGLFLSSDQLVITHGCLDAITIALETITKPNDVIAITSPCYSGLLDILRSLDRAVIEIPSTKDGLNLSVLKTLMSSKQINACLFTANFQNPTGHSLTNTQKKELASLASQYEIPIVEDDVFRELSHNALPSLPIKYYDQTGWVLWCSSLSKTLAPGLRIGWCSPGRYTQSYIGLRKTKTLGVNEPIQLAIADYLAKGHYQRYLKRINKTLALHVNYYVSYLSRNLPSCTTIYYPDGGLVLWVQINNLDSRKLTSILTKQEVFIQPGHIFSSTALYNDCFRINIGLIPSEKIKLQLDIIIKAVELMIRE